MSALLDDLDAVIADHDCPHTIRVHSLIRGMFSSYACDRCADAVKAIALKHLPTATDVVMESRG